MRQRPPTKNTIAALLLAVAVMTLCSGCTGKSVPARHYMLNPIEAFPSRTFDGSGGRSLSFGVGPIELPPYLDRPQIVMQTTDNMVILKEHDRWAEPLRDGFTRVLIRNLAQLLNSDAVYPLQLAKRFEDHYQIAIQVYAFDIAEQRYAQLDVVWAVVNGADGRLLFKKRFIDQQAVSAGGINAHVSALNATLSAFSREMAEELRFLVR